MFSLGVYTQNLTLVFREFMGPLLDAVKMGDREAARGWTYPPVLLIIIRLT